MSRISSWRKALSLPVVISLALGGALLTAGPASAATEPVPSTSETATPTESPAPAESPTPTESEPSASSDAPAPADDAPPVTDEPTVPGEDAPAAPSAAAAPAPAFEVLTPEMGDVFTTQTITFSGVGESGTLVDIAAKDWNYFELEPFAEDVPVVDGAWSVTLDLPLVESVAVAISSTQQTDGADTVVEFNITLPSQAELWGLKMLTPTPMQQFDTRTVTISGVTETDVELRLTVFTAAGESSPITVTGGAWSYTQVFPETSGRVQTVSVVATDGFSRGSTGVTFLLPEPELFPAPVIETPTPGQALVGDVVTFSGTATPNHYIAVALLPTAFYNALQNELEDIANGTGDNARLALPEGQDAAPVDPRAPILVGEDGRWSVTVAVAPGDYTAVASLVYDPNAAVPQVTSLPSAPVQFTLAATASATSGHGPTLAETGADTTAPLGLAAMLLLGGLALVAVRKRRAQLS